MSKVKTIMLAINLLLDIDSIPLIDEDAKIP